MVWEEILQQIAKGATNSSLTELIAVIFGFLSVWYARNENILVFPTGIINVGIFIYICAQYKLYADMGINIYYLIISIYGWIMWSRKTENNKPLLVISKNSCVGNITGIVMALVFTSIIYFVLINYTDSDVPLWDSLTTGIFIVSMILMARKKIEHWLGWIVGNIISIPLYLYKGLAFTSFQYLIFTILAISGYINWKKSIRRD